MYHPSLTVQYLNMSSGAKLGPLGSNKSPDQKEDDFVSYSEDTYAEGIPTMMKYLSIKGLIHQQ